MSRSKRFALSLISGYVQLVVNSLFTLISVRMALSYLPHDEYALWMPVTAIAAYIALLDFGLSTAASRILIDYKDQPHTGHWGAFIQTTLWVGLSQAALILLAGIALAFVMGPLLNIPVALRHQFFWLVLGQCAVTAAMFATRPAVLILNAHQRYDIGNYASSLALVVNGTVMWACFARGVGVYALMWGQVGGVVTASAVNAFYCVKLKLLPGKGQWGRPTWEKFGELFVFGRDVFLFLLGLQVIYVSQTLLLTPLIGLEAALIWGVCTRAYIVLVQIIGRIFDFSASALAEMMVRGERERLLRRFREIAVLAVNLSVVAGTALALTNGPFVDVWTKGQIHWSPVNDLLVGIWLVITITARVHLGLVGLSKAFRFLRYLVFIEAAAFVGLTILLHRWGGITIMVVMSILCSFAFTVPYGLWRTCQYFELSWLDLARWHRGTLTLVLWLVPVGGLLWWGTRELPSFPRLVVEAVMFGAWSALIFLRYGLGASLYTEACARLPGWARPMLLRLTPRA